jgi:hypothetical protein
MFLRLIAGAVLLSSVPAYANLGNKTNFEVRTTGSSTNGGCFDPGVASPGTDYSQQNAAQVAYTDLVIGGTNTQLTSVAFPFDSTDVGNCLQVTGGTGFTTGLYEVVSVSGITATMDRAVGTAASTGGTGNLGGAHLIWYTAATWAGVLNTGGAWVGFTYLKCGTYTMTAQISVGSNYYFPVIGYNATHNDTAVGCRPLITTSTNGTNLVYTCSSFIFKNLDMSNTAASRALGYYVSCNNVSIFLDNVTMTGFSNALNGDDAGSHFILAYIYIVNSIIQNSTAEGVRTYNNGFLVLIDNSIFRNNAAGGFICNNTIGIEVVTNSVFYSNGSPGGMSCQVTQGAFVKNSAFVSNTGYGIAFGSPGLPPTIENSIFYANTTWGWNTTTAYQWAGYMRSNAYGANGTAPFTGWSSSALPSINDVTLTADPFTNKSGGDFSLNSTVGGGAALKAVGFPGPFITGSGVGNLDIGLIQSTGGATVTMGAFNYGSAN